MRDYILKMTPQQLYTILESIEDYCNIYSDSKAVSTQRLIDVIREML